MANPPKWRSRAVHAKTAHPPQQPSSKTNPPNDELNHHSCLLGNAAPVSDARLPLPETNERPNGGEVAMEKRQPDQSRRLTPPRCKLRLVRQTIVLASRPNVERLPRIAGASSRRRPRAPELPAGSARRNRKPYDRADGSDRADEAVPVETNASRRNPEDRARNVDGPNGPKLSDRGHGDARTWNARKEPTAMALFAGARC